MITESDLVKKIQLLSTENNNRLLRNSVGLAYSKEGTPIRYGLVVGSGDLIGWTRRLLTPEMVGSYVAVFTSIECKKPKGRTTTSLEQLIWNESVINAGGISAIIRSEDEYLKAIGVK